MFEGEGPGNGERGPGEPWEGDVLDGAGEGCGPGPCFTGEGVFPVDGPRGAPPGGGGPGARVVDVEARGVPQANVPTVPREPSPGSNVPPSVSALVTALAPTSCTVGRSTKGGGGFGSLFGVNSSALRRAAM
jgi:hypothetical protein